MHHLYLFSLVVATTIGLSTAAPAQPSDPHQSPPGDASADLHSNDPDSATMSYIETTNRLWNHALRHDTGDIVIAREIVCRYWEATNASKRTEEEERRLLDQDAEVIKYVHSHYSNLKIEQAPTTANGFVLVVVPIRPELPSRGMVYDETGKPVWIGTISATQRIDLSRLPAGEYFVLGMGKPIAFSLGRAQR